MWQKKSNLFWWSTTISTFEAGIPVDVIYSDTVDSGLVFSPLVKPKKKRSSNKHCWLDQNFLCKDDGWPHNRDQVTGRASALKPVFLVAKPWNYIVVWCSLAQKDFFSQANTVKEASVKQLYLSLTTPVIWPVLVTEFHTFAPIKFEKCRRTAWLHCFTSIQDSWTLDWNLTRLVLGCGGVYFCQMKGS